MQTFKLEKLPFPSVAPLSHYINYLELFTYFPSFRPQVQTLSTENYIHSFFWSEKTIYGNTHLFLSEIREGEKGWHLIHVLWLPVFSYSIAKHKSGWGCQ